MEKFSGRLIVVPDNTTKGSEGRLCLHFPNELSSYVGMKFKFFGCLGEDGVCTFVASPDGLTVTPKGQIWWKNGVRDHKVREDWKVTIYPLESNIFVVVMFRRTGRKPVLPMRQETFF